jgi:hypothetical protein
VKLLPPSYVRPYVQRSKTDRADVKGMREAWRNSEIRPVPGQDRFPAANDRASSNAIDMDGDAYSKNQCGSRHASRVWHRDSYSASRVTPAVMELLELADNGLPIVVRNLLHELLSEIRQLESYVEKAERQLQALSQKRPRWRD